MRMEKPVYESLYVICDYEGCTVSVRGLIAPPTYMLGKLLQSKHMKRPIAIYFCFAVWSTLGAQTPYQWSVKIGSTFNKSNIIESDDGYFVDSGVLDGFDMFERTEFGLFHTRPLKQKYELELGFRYTALAAELAGYDLSDTHSILNGGVERLEYLYYNFSLGLRCPLQMNKAIRFIPSIEANFSMIDDSFLKSDFTICVSGYQSIYAVCTEKDYLNGSYISSGLGVGG